METKTELERLQAEIERLNLALQQQKQRLFYLQQENTRLTRQTEEYNKTSESLEKALAESEQARNNLQLRLERAQHDLANLQATRTVRMARLMGIANQSIRQLTSDLKQRSPLKGGLDILPLSSFMLGEGLKVTGWAISKAGRVETVEIWLGKIRLGLAYYGIARPDVATSRPLDFSPDCGFVGEFSLDAPRVSRGSHLLRAIITDSRGNQREFFGQQIVIEDLPRLPYPTKLGPFDYQDWITINEPGAEELAKQRHQDELFNYRPLISLLTELSKFNGTVEDLQTTFASITAQTYTNLEWIINYPAQLPSTFREFLQTITKRDNRIRLSLKSAQDTDWNTTLTLSKGEFVALLEVGDSLAPNALYENVTLLQHYPQATMVYSDEDFLDKTGQRCNPAFKPDWSPDYFRSFWYTGKMALYRAELVRDIGGFRANFDGMQEYDLALRLIEESNEIYHIPRLLYHSQVGKRYPLSNEVLVRAVAEHVERLEITGEVMPGMVENTTRLRYRLTNEPKISIIIPTRDQVELLRQCIETVQQLTTYRNFEIIVVDNQSHEPASFDYFNSLRNQPDLRLLSYPQPFNFAAINNFAVEQARGELLLFLNNDIEVIEGEWLRAMVEHAIRPEVGVVGARLLYPDRTLQHGGVVIGVGGQAGHAQKHLAGSDEGYLKRAKTVQNFSAVTGACLMTPAALFRELGGFEESLAVAFNDVDYCLRVRRKGLLVVWTPYAELIHHESISRGRDDLDPAKAARFQREVQYMHRHWEDLIRDDPYYNPNLTIEVEDFSIAPLARYREL